MSSHELSSSSDTSPAAEPAHGPAATSRAARVVVVLVVAGFLVLRLPGTIDTVARAMPADVVADVGDPRLVDLVVHIGALLGLALTLVSVVVFLVVAAVLERHVPSPVLGAGRLRAGAFTATVGACSLVTQVHGVLTPPTVHAGLAPVALALATGVLVGLGYAWRARGSATVRRAAAGVLATSGLALAMSVTTLSA